MRYAAGIDLGSTTTKAVILDEEGRIRGRGITNSRSNYDLACQVALTEALITTRFGLLAGALRASGMAEARATRLLSGLERLFRREQYRGALAVLRQVMRKILDRTGLAGTAGPHMERIVDTMDAEADSLFSEGASRKSDFFRDLAGSRYVALAEKASREGGAEFDLMNALYDKAILEVENTPMDAGGFHDLLGSALRDLGGVAPGEGPVLAAAVRTAADTELVQISSVGTGYGRARLPFPKERIRSEILCHGLGAHAMFPGTRTVLDIGGQDTKAIQIDAEGIVTSFQMNDRCAAGCGRYLGYIADEMSLGLHELGPLAQTSHRAVRISSTCTARWLVCASGSRSGRSARTSCWGSTARSSCGPCRCSRAPGASPTSSRSRAASRRTRPPWRRSRASSATPTARSR